MSLLNDIRNNEETVKKQEELIKKFMADEIDDGTEDKLKTEQPFEIKREITPVSDIMILQVPSPIKTTDKIIDRPQPLGEPLIDKLKGQIIYDLNHVPKLASYCSSIISDYNMALYYLAGYKLEELAEIFHLSYSTIRNRVVLKLGLAQTDRNGTMDHKISKLLSIKSIDTKEDINTNEIIELIQRNNMALELKFAKLETQIVRIETTLDRLIPLIVKVEKMLFFSKGD
jgi:hypothetical protein